VQLDRPFAVATPTLDGDVLAALVYRREVGSTAGQIQYLLPAHSTHGVRRVLTRLVEQGVVLARPVGNTHEYRLNRDHLAAPAILAIASARRRLVARIGARLARWPTPPVFAALFGPAAGPSMATGDRIDLFIAHAEGTTGTEVDKGVASLASTIRGWTGNAVHIVVMAEDEAPGRTCEPLLVGLRHDCLRILGSPSWVEHQFRLARETRAPATRAT
jgi:hypothetical protein